MEDEKEKEGKGVLVALSSGAEEIKCVRRSWRDSDPQVLHFKGLSCKKLDFSSVISLNMMLFFNQDVTVISQAESEIHAYLLKVQRYV